MHSRDFLHEFRLIRNYIPLPLFKFPLFLVEVSCTILFTGQHLKGLCCTTHISFCYVSILFVHFFFFFLFLLSGRSHTKRQLSSISVVPSCTSPLLRHSVWMSRSAEQVGEVAPVIEPNAEEANKHRPPSNQPLILRFPVSTWTQQYTCTERRKMSPFCRRFLQTVNPAHPKQPPPLPFFNFLPLCLLMFLLPAAAVFCYHPVAAWSVA